MARVFIGYASQYSADTVQQCRVRRYQKRKLRVNFNGLIPKGEVIDQIIWDTNGPWVTRMSDAAPSPDGRTAELVVIFNYWGTSSIRCQVLASGGDIFNYEFYFVVTNSPIMPGDTYGAPSGPFRLVWQREVMTTNITVFNSVLNLEASEHFDPIPSGFAIYDDFSVITEGGEAEFVYFEEGNYYFATGSQVSGDGTITQGSNTWSCNITYVQS